MIRLYRLLHVAALIALVVPALGTLWTAAAQTRVDGVFSVGIPGVESGTAIAGLAEVPVGPSPADVQAVWDLGAAGSWNAAGRRLAALETSNASWTPPGHLKVFLAKGQNDQHISDAIAARDWAGVLARLPADWQPACEPQSHLWARADAVEGLGDAEQIKTFYITALSNCDDAGLVAALAGRAVSVLDADGLSALRALESFNRGDDPKVVLAYARITREESRRRSETAARAGDLATVADLASHSDDPRLLAHAGWTFLDSDAALAAEFFERALAGGSGDDVRRGLVLATLATGNISAARRALSQGGDPTMVPGLAARIDIEDAVVHRSKGDWQGAIALAASASSRNPDLAEAAQAISGGALIDAASKAYESGNYKEAGRLSRQAAAYRPTQRAGRMRAAWSDLQLGNASAAASAFSRLYLDAPDTESAEGYALAAEKSGGLGTAAALARSLGGPLGPKVDARFAAAAFNQGDYLTARAYAPDAYKALDGLDRTWYRQAVSARSQGGNSGGNRIRGVVSTTSVGTSRGTNRFEAGLAVYTLDADESASPFVDASRQTFAAPYLGWSREGDASLAVRIGLLPVGTDAGPQLTGEIAVAHEKNGHAVEGRMFVRPKTDSVLAHAGQRDAVTGHTFGRVVESGALVRARLPVGRKNAVQADVLVTQLEGENTDDNAMVSTGISASRSVARDGFAYLVTGPFYQFQSYDRNSNFFTAGHGGYFSPQAFHRAGWSANAQTDPLKNWIVKADWAVAYESVNEDPAIANPLVSVAQPLVGGGSSTGLAGALDVAVAYRISRDVIASANAAAIASKAYEDVRVGIALTWTPGGRAGLQRRDLPSDPFNPASWIQP